MPLKLCIVNNTTIDKNLYELIDVFEGNINLELLHNLLFNWNFSIEEINNIKFIIDSEQIIDPNINYVITKNDIKTIFILTSDLNIKYKLQKMFIDITNYNNNICKQKNNYNKNNENDNNLLLSDDISLSLNSIAQNEISQNEISQNEISQNDVKLNQELINNININTISLFNDNDFKHLLNIYLNKPELYSIFLKYIQNVDVVEHILNNDSIDNLTTEKLIYYTNLVDKINDLNLGFNYEKIMNTLIKYSGHLNLTLRSLLIK